MTVTLDGESLTVPDVVRVAREDEPVELSESAREAVRTARERVEDVLDSGEAVYGLNTGFGDLVDTRIPREQVDELQTNLLRSHACGVGGDLTCDVVEQIPIYPDSGYSKQLSWYDGCRQMKIEYFDHKDEHVKTQLFSDYREYYGKHWRGHLNTMINHVTGRQTRLEIDEFIYRTPMDGRDFTPEALPFLVQ